MQKCVTSITQYLLERKLPAHGESNTKETDSMESHVSRRSTKRSDVIEMLLDPNAVKGHSPLGTDALVDEAIMLLAAGNDTTAGALYSGIYQICRNSEIQQRLEKELFSAFSSGQKATYNECKQLPYLVRKRAVVKAVHLLTNPILECNDQGDPPLQHPVTRPSSPQSAFGRVRPLREQNPSERESC